VTVWGGGGNGDFTPVPLREPEGEGNIKGPETVNQTRRQLLGGRGGSLHARLGWKVEGGEHGVKSLYSGVSILT